MTTALNTTADDVFNALKGSIANLGPNELKILQKQANDIATGFESIAADKLSGAITETQAADAVKALADTGTAQLQLQLGILELSAKGAIKSGLNALATAIATSVGLGWAGPIIQNVINGL